MAALSDRALSRLIAGSLLVLVIGIPLVAAIYVMDRWVAPGPGYVERHTQELEAAVRMAPNDVDTRLQLAGAYLAGRRDADALGQLNEVLRVQPANKNALLARGSLYQGQGNITAAERDYQAIVDEMKGREFAGEDRELASALYGLGQIALSRGRAADAIDHLTAALRIDGTNADALYALGNAYVAAAEPPKAIDAYRKAVAFVPVEWPEPYQALVAAYTGERNGPEAAWAAAMVDVAGRRIDQGERALSALTNGPAATDAYLGLGMIAELRGDDAAATAAYREVLRRDSQNFNAAAGLSRIAQPGGSVAPAVPAAPAPGGDR